MLQVSLRRCSVRAPDQQNGTAAMTMVIILVLWMVLGLVGVQADARRWNLISHAMARNLDTHQRPLEVTSTFSSTDERALSWFEIEFLDLGPAIVTGKVTFRWKWYEPTGSLYRQHEVTIDLTLKQPKNLYDEMQIRGSPAEKKTGEWRIEVYSGEEPLFEEKFGIEPARTFSVRLAVSGLDSTYRTGTYVNGAILAHLTDDDVRYLELVVGASHNLSVDAIVAGKTGVRYVCSPNQITISVPVDITFIYEKEFYLTVSSEHGSPRGEGWYKAGSVASLSVTSPVSGGTGVQYVFQRWTGDVSATSATASVLMDGPKSVVAVWAADYTQLYLIAGVIALFVAGTVIVPAVRRWRRRMASSAKKPKGPSKVCSVCGGSAALIPNVQRYYCPNCKRYV